MKAFLYFLTITSLSVVSYGQLTKEEWKEYCGLPMGIVAILYNCLDKSLQDEPKQKLMEIQACANTTVLDAVRKMCLSDNENDMDNLVACEEQIGSLRDAPIDEGRAAECINNRLG